MYHLVHPDTIPVWVEAGGATVAQEDELAFAELEAALLDDLADEDAFWLELEITAGMLEVVRIVLVVTPC